MQRWIDEVLARFGQAAGWAVGFSLVLAVLMVGLGVILLAATFLAYTWKGFHRMITKARRAALHRLIDAVIDLADDGDALTAIPIQGQVLSTTPAPADPPVDPAAFLGDTAIRRTIGARKALKEVLHTFGPSKPADAIRQVLVANPTLTVDQIRRAFHAAKRDNLTTDDGGIWRWLDSDPT